MATTRKPTTHRPVPKTERKPARKPSTNGRRKPAEGKPEVPAVTPPAESTPETERPPIKNPAEFDFASKGAAIRAAVAVYHNVMKTIRDRKSPGGVADIYDQILDAQALLKFFGVVAVTQEGDNGLMVIYYRNGEAFASFPADGVLASWMME